MKQLVSRIDPKTGERVNFLEDMTKAQIAALEASRNVPPPVPVSISDRQFANQLKIQGVITHAEALAFVQTGTIPAALAVIVAAIPDQAAREDAELLMAGAVQFRRDHPLTSAIAVACGWTGQQTDDFFRAAAQL